MTIVMNRMTITSSIPKIKIVIIEEVKKWFSIFNNIVIAIINTSNEILMLTLNYQIMKIFNILVIIINPMIFSFSPSLKIQLLDKCHLKIMKGGKM